MVGEKKKHEPGSLRSSSMRCDSASTAKIRTSHHVTSVGCMSGIFQFVSKYHTRRKFLTFGKKQETKATSPPPAKPQPPENATNKSRDHGDSSARLSLEVPRSPAIPPEIRKTPLHSLNLPQAVTSLMGLNDTPVDRPEPVTTEAAAEKRRKLLGALERCDEDLQALKKIISAVRASQKPPPRTPPRAVVQYGGVKDEVEEEDEKEDEVGSEEPSPVSVLDHHMLLARSPSISCSKRTREGEILQQQRQHPSIRKNPAEVDRASLSFHVQQLASSKFTSNPQSLHFPTKIRPQLNTRVNTSSPTTTPWRSAIRETVIEVCRDVEWGRRREVASIVLLLQDIICRDLLDEIIQEFNCMHICSTYPQILPYEACKRKLCF